MGFPLSLWGEINTSHPALLAVRNWAHCERPSFRFWLDAQTQAGRGVDAAQMLVAFDEAKGGLRFYGMSLWPPPL